MRETYNIIYYDGYSCREYQGISWDVAESLFERALAARVVSRSGNVLMLKGVN